MLYECIGGAWNGCLVTSALAKKLRKEGYRNATLGERHAWGWGTLWLVQD